MLKKIIIFGLSDIAEVAYYYFSNDSEYEVVAFTVDRKYLPETNFFCSLPVVSFEEVENKYPPSNFSMFIAMSYNGLNEHRKTKYEIVKQMGYTLPSYISSKATLLNNKENIGDNCFILENNVIQPFVTIQDNVILWSGNHIGHHSTIKAHTFIASHVVISGGVEVGEQCFIGVNATIRDHISIGEKCIIGAGATILENCEPEGIYATKTTIRSKVPSSKLTKL